MKFEHIIIVGTVSILLITSSAFSNSLCEARLESKKLKLPEWVLVNWTEVQVVCIEKFVQTQN